MTRFGLRTRLAAAGAVALALAACDDRGGRVDAPEPPSLAELSAASELPYAEPARVDYRAPDESYAWAERAYGLQRAVYDTPPDYGFEYDGIEPLAWETEDDWAMYAEPWDDGYRYYYYEPGVDYPYFVRDGGYGYAYDAGGILIAVFDSGGRYLPADDARRFAPAAGRYWMRGHDLRAAAGRSRRAPVSQQVWAQRAPQLIRTADPWMRAAREDRAWRAWRERDQDRELRRFQREAERRDQRARGWRGDGDHREVAAIQAPERGWQRQAQEDERRRPSVRADEQRDQRRRFAEQAQAQRQQRQQAQRQPRDEIRQRAELQQRQQVRAQQEQRQKVAQQQRTQHEQARKQGEQTRREQARAEQAHQQAAQRQQAQQQRQQAEQAQRQHMRQQAAEQQRAQHEQRQQAQRQQMAQQQRGQRQARREQQAHQQRQAQQQARAAGQHAQPAAARERGGGPDHGRGHGRKD